MTTPAAIPAIACWHCRSADVRTCLAQWHATATDPCDDDNTAALDEHQCADCGTSMWTARSD
jgi:hypothetical protein